MRAMPCVDWFTVISEENTQSRWYDSTIRRSRTSIWGKYNRGGCKFRARLLEYSIKDWLCYTRHDALETMPMAGDSEKASTSIGLVSIIVKPAPAFPHLAISNDSTKVYIESSKRCQFLIHAKLKKTSVFWVFVINLCSEERLALLPTRLPPFPSNRANLLS